MSFYSKKLARVIHRWPGRKQFGMYRFLPFFFVLGGGIEWFMIHANIAPGGETFYDVYRRREAERQYEARLNPEETPTQAKW